MDDRGQSIYGAVHTLQGLSERGDFLGPLVPEVPTELGKGGLSELMPTPNLG